MQDLAIRFLSVLLSATSTGVGNMSTSAAQLFDMPYGDKSGTQFSRYGYGGHDRTFGRFYFNDRQTYRRVLKLAHRYQLQLFKIADIFSGGGSGSVQGEPSSQYDGTREESVHSRQRLANHPLLETLASNLWIRLALLMVLFLGAFIYCLMMMEQQQAEIAGRGTNWWADMSPLTSVMSSGSSSAATTSTPPSTPRDTERNASEDAPVGLGVQLPVEPVPESTTRDTSSRAGFTWPSLATLISTIARSTTTALALTSGTIDMSDVNENNDNSHSALHFLENSLDVHPYSLLQRNLTERSGGNSEARFSLRANNNNGHREMVPVTKSRRRSKARKYVPLANNRREETRNKAFNSSIGGFGSSNSSAGSSRTCSRRQSVASFASSSSISKRRPSVPVDPCNTDNPTTAARRLQLVDSGYFLAMVLIYYSYPYMYTFFRLGIPSPPSSSSKAMTGLSSRRGVASIASRNTTDRQARSHASPHHLMRTQRCIQRRQHSMPLQRSCRFRHRRETQYHLRFGRFVHHQQVPSSARTTTKQAMTSIRRCRAKFARLNPPPLSSS